MILLKFLSILFLGFILLVIAVAASMAFRFWGLFRSIVNGNGNAGIHHNTKKNRETSSGQTTSSPSQTTQGKKIFAPDEGEYVDFEEIP